MSQNFSTSQDVSHASTWPSLELFSIRSTNRFLPPPQKKTQKKEEDGFLFPLPFFIKGQILFDLGWPDLWLIFKSFCWLASQASHDIYIFRVR